MQRNKAEARVKEAKRRNLAKRSKKPVDLADVRKQIETMVGAAAIDMVETTIAEVDKGHYAAMKFLFEMVGLYPAGAQEAAPSEDGLAEALAKRWALPDEEVELERVVSS